MGDWYSTTWTGDQFWAAGGGANSLPTQLHQWRISGRGCAASWLCQGPLLSDDRDERSQRRKSHPGCHQPRKFHKFKFNFVSANFFHFHSTPFLLLSPFPFTHQNSINSVILIIMISLVLSDEGSRNTPKAYKQVLTLMAGVSTEVISQTLLLGRLYINVMYST